MQERKPGCICELNAETGQPEVENYEMCPVHKQDAILPKDFAKALYGKFMVTLKINDMRSSTNPFAKECAESCVDEILDVLESFGRHEYAKVLIPHYESVKKEIQNL